MKFQLSETIWWWIEPCGEAPFHLKGHKSISIVFSLIPIHLLTTRLATLKHSATVAREARVQAQEVGVINLKTFIQGDTGLGYLVVVVT